MTELATEDQWVCVEPSLAEEVTEDHEWVCVNHVSLTDDNSSASRALPDATSPKEVLQTPTTRDRGAVDITTNRYIPHVYCLNGHIPHVNYLNGQSHEYAHTQRLHVTKFHPFVPASTL